MFLFCDDTVMNAGDLIRGLWQNSGHCLTGMSSQSASPREEKRTRARVWREAAHRERAGLEPEEAQSEEESPARLLSLRAAHADTQSGGYILIYEAFTRSTH